MNWLDGPEADTTTIDLATGAGLSFTVDSEYADAPEVVEFCPTDAFTLNLLECGTNKVPTIVSPKTCTHCQVARCVGFEQISRYDLWNPQFFVPGTTQYKAEILDKEAFTPSGFWEPKQDGSSIQEAST